MPLPRGSLGQHPPDFLRLLPSCPSNQVVAEQGDDEDTKREAEGNEEERRVLASQGVIEQDQKEDWEVDDECEHGSVEVEYGGVGELDRFRVSHVSQSGLYEDLQRGLRLDRSKILRRRTRTRQSHFP
jgi:hypothetical protein